MLRRAQHPVGTLIFLILFSILNHSIKKFEAVSKVFIHDKDAKAQRKNNIEDSNFVSLHLRGRF
jgi:hypothetical protein